MPAEQGAAAPAEEGDRAGDRRPTRRKRADAVRNTEAIIGAAIRLLAVDPSASVNEIAKEAGVGRITLYGHFDSRAGLLREVAERAIRDTEKMLTAVDVTGDPRDALGRVLQATWRLTHRFGALVVVAARERPPEDVRRMHEAPAARVRQLLERGQDAGQFRSDMPVEWQLSVVQALLHGASDAVRRGDIAEHDAAALVRDTVLAAIAV